MLIDLKDSYGASCHFCILVDFFPPSPIWVMHPWLNTRWQVTFLAAISTAVKSACRMAISATYDCTMSFTFEVCGNDSLLSCPSILWNYFHSRPLPDSIPIFPKICVTQTYDKYVQHITSHCMSLSPSSPWLQMNCSVSTAQLGPASRHKMHMRLALALITYSK